MRFVVKVIFFPTKFHKMIYFIRSNLRVAQNGRFVVNPIYLGGGNMVAKMLEFRLSENLTMPSSGSFALPNYP